MSKQESPTRPETSRALLGLAALVAATLLAGAASQARRDAPGPAGTHVTAAGGQPVAFSANLDRTGVLQGSDGLVRAELLLRAEAREDAPLLRRPTDLVVVLDRSGSMRGEKIRDARAAVHELIAQLQPEDRFALVGFSNTASTVVELGAATPAARQRWARSVDGVEAGGGTRMSTGLDLALATLDAAGAGRAARLILISDGLAAETPAALRTRAERTAAREWALSAVGVGLDFDESLMGMLADVGTGNYYYLEDAVSLAHVFRDEFETARTTVATGLRVRIDAGAGVEVVDAAGYPLERRAGSVTFQPGSLFAGQERRIWVTLRVPTGTPGEHPFPAITLEYSADGERHALSLGDLPRIACVAEERDYLASLDEDRWARGVVVEEYNALRQSVARSVKEGRREDALDAIRSFRDRNQRLNAPVAAPSVAAKIEAASELASDVAEAFAGGDQALKQNSLGKALHAESQQERRVGGRR